MKISYFKFWIMSLLNQTCVKLTPLSMASKLSKKWKKIYKKNQENTTISSYLTLECQSLTDIRRPKRLLPCSNKNGYSCLLNKTSWRNKATNKERNLIWCKRISLSSSLVLVTSMITLKNKKWRKLVSMIIICVLFMSNIFQLSLKRWIQERSWLKNLGRINELVGS